LANVDIALTKITVDAVGDDVADPVPTRVYLEFVEIALYSFILDSI
jgi:hypothetical protein